MRILVVAVTRDPHRQAEALRAALGLTLRGARVEVAVAEPLLTPLARRAADTLRAFGHTVGHLGGELDGDLGGDLGDLSGNSSGNRLADALARADRVEVWT